MTEATAYDKFSAAVFDRYCSVKPAASPAPPAQVVEEIRHNLEKNLLSCAPKNCGIVKVVASPIMWDAAAAEEFEEFVEPPGPLFLLEGIDGGGKRSLRIHLLFFGPVVHLTLILNPGHEASSDDYGKKLTSRYNVIVLALFGLSAVGIYSHGYRLVSNSPLDENVRKLYSKMGFANGANLDLADKGSMKTLAVFAGHCLSLFKIDPAPLLY